MVNMTTAEMQKYWDAMLIRSWRNFGNLCELRQMFAKTCGIEVWNTAVIRQTPPLNGYVGTRVFAATYLPKINDRLLNHDKSKDVEFLRFLQSSKYNTLEVAIPDKSKNNIKSQISRNEKRVSFEHKTYSGRNRNTDWNVTK